MVGCTSVCLLFFVKQKTAYEMRISDWSSDVCSSDLIGRAGVVLVGEQCLRECVGDKLRRVARSLDVLCSGADADRTAGTNLVEVVLIAGRQGRITGAGHEQAGGGTQAGCGFHGSNGSAPWRERECEYG